MIISADWLKEYIALPKNLASLLDGLTNVGLEVEEVRRRDLDTSHLRIAQIKASEKHPNADRLSVCTVESKEGTHSVVCGAKNYKVGDKVILALPGAVLPGNFKIKKSKIRGVESGGMLCSEAELQLADNADGILILPADTPLNGNLKSLLGLGQTVFELNITPNRPDCMSFLGVAREISAILKKPIRWPKIKIKESKTPIKSRVKLTLKDAAKCPRYMGRLIENVTIGPSPEWLRRRLESIGQRSINNVVDVTNFVMMEWGHPLHAFDFDGIKNQTVIIRSAREGETMMTLDGKRRLLKTSDLVIADAERPIALGGIMGGSTSEVSNKTTNIFLESAVFSPPVIRRTSKRLGLTSESSKRFERGVDVEGARMALERATELIVSVAGGSITKGSLDAYPKKRKPKTIILRMKRLKQFVGYDLSSSKVKSTLKHLGFRIKTSSTSKMTVGIPTHRIDVAEEVDLIEEVARHQGYDRIPTLEPVGSPNLEQRIESSDLLSDQCRLLLKGAGFCEVVNYSFYSPADLKKMGWSEKEGVRLQNPLGADYSVMRPSLVPSLLNTVEKNLRYHVQRLKIFECRHVYDKNRKQKKMLVGLITGARYPLNWGLVEVETDFFDIKAVVTALLKSVGITGKGLDATALKNPQLFQPGLASSIQDCVRFGKVHPSIQGAFKIQQPVYLFEMDIEKLQSLKRKGSAFHPISKYPPVTRDLSLLVPTAESLTFKELQRSIQKAGGELLTGIDLFDRYEGKSIPEGYRSMTFALRFHSHERTLKDEEVNRAHQAICKHLQDAWKVKIR